MKRIGRTIVFDTPVYIQSWASAVGKKESEGPLAQDFDILFYEDTLGQSSWEKAEMELCKTACRTALDKASLSFSDMDIAMGGDLLNQCTASSFAHRDSQVPFLGLYGACSTMAEGLLTGSVFVASGAANAVMSSASSHFCSAERQYRSPIEYGGQRTPTAQWTVTGAGCAILSRTPSTIQVTKAMVGKICDLGVCDAANMGAAMAPAAYDTIHTFFSDTGTSPADYDLIVTGDLGQVGRDVVLDLFSRDKIDMKAVYTDCGCMIFNESQDTHAGGSGCGCSAAVLNSRILKRMHEGTLKKVLFCGTGALLSPTTSFQGESIPGICHLVQLEVAQ